MKKNNVSNAKWQKISRGLKIKKSLIIFFLLFFSGHVFSQANENRVLMSTISKPNPDASKVKLEYLKSAGFENNDLLNKIIFLDQEINKLIIEKEINDNVFNVYLNKLNSICSECIIQNRLDPQITGKLYTNNKEKGDLMLSFLEEFLTNLSNN